MKKTASLTLTQKAVRALNEAVAKVVDDHRRQGRPLAVWREGKAVWLPVPAIPSAAQEAQAPYAKKAQAAATPR